MGASIALTAGDLRENRAVISRSHQKGDAAKIPTCKKIALVKIVRLRPLGTLFGQRSYTGENTGDCGQQTEVMERTETECGDPDKH
jgi:hypothetical protein